MANNRSGGAHDRECDRGGDVAGDGKLYASCSEASYCIVWVFGAFMIEKHDRERSSIDSLELTPECM